MTDYDWVEACKVKRLRAALDKKYREGYDNALAEQHVEIERLRAQVGRYEAASIEMDDAWRKRIKDQRNAVIEECARVAEKLSMTIRALKDKP